MTLQDYIDLGFTEKQAQALIKNGEYYRKRSLQLEDALHNKGARYLSDLNDQFVIAQKEIEKEIRSWYQRFADNNGISITEARKWLTSKELAELKWDVKEYIKYGQDNAKNQLWMKQLENASARYHISRLDALKIQTQQTLEVLYGNHLDGVDTLARNIYTDGFYHTAFDIQKGKGFGEPITAIDNNRLEKIVSKPWAVDDRNFSERIWGNKQKLINETHQELTQMCVLGKSPDDAIKNIAKKFNTSKNQAGRLVMTESAYFASESQKDCYKELGVEYFQVVATLDSKTSEICQEMDGKVFPFKDYEVGATAPPFHPWCRSTTIPVFDDDFDDDGDIGTRAARGEDGKTYSVPADMTYKQWEQTFVDDEVIVNQNVANGQEDGKIKVNQGVTSLSECKTTDDVVNLFKEHDDWFRVAHINGKVYKSVDEISLDGVDLESAKAVYRPFEKVFEKFPQLKGNLEGVSSDKLGADVYAECFFGFGHGGIGVNTRYFSNINRLVSSISKDEASGFHVKGLVSPDSIVMHELGHAIDDFLTYTKCIAGMNGKKPKIVSSYLRPKVMRACGMTISDISNEVSGYATKNAQEWFAECFVEYMLAEKPRKVATVFGEMLEDIMKGVQ